jgi:DNA-directed RNA polymerase specialized sigma24 family protein
MGFSMSEAQHAPLADLILEAQADSSNDSIAMTEMIKRYEPLARSVVAAIKPNENDREDLLNAARLGVVRAVRKHDGRTTGFASYLRRYMRGEALRAVERVKRVDVLFGEDLMPEPGTAEVVVPNIPLHVLNHKQLETVRLYYWEDQTYATIARAEKVSLSAVRQRMLTIHKVLALTMSVAA